MCRLEKPIAVYLYFLLIAFILYFNALGNSFIFDDNVLIRDNLYVKNFSLAKIFSSHIFYFNKRPPTANGEYYRPLQSLSHAIEYTFWKLTPAGYRLTNILLHSFNGLLLFLIVYFIFKDKLFSFLSGVFFIIHPLQVSLVSFIGTRSSLLECFFSLLAIAGFIRYTAINRRGFYWVSLLAFIFALLSREGALLLPLYLLTCGVFLKTGLKRLFLRLIPYIIIAAFYIILRRSFIPCRLLNISGAFSLSGLREFTLQAFRYFQQFIVPLVIQPEAGFSVFIHSRPKTTPFMARMDFGPLSIPLWETAGFSPQSFIFSALCLVLLFYLALRAILFRDRAVLFGSLIFFLGMLPVINLTAHIKDFGPVISEHYGYSAALGFSLLLAQLVRDLIFRSRRWAWFILTSGALFYCGLTVASNRYYRNENSYYNYILKYDSHNRIALLNMGNEYYRQGDYERAFREVRAFLTLEPEAWDGYLLLGNILQAQGRLDSALRYFKQARRLNPKSAGVLNNIALVYRAQGRHQEAYRALKESLLIEPSSVLALHNLFNLFYEDKQYPQAIAVCERALEIDPQNIEARVNSGIVLAKLGYLKEAEVILKQALALDSSSLSALKNLAFLYANTGRLEEAAGLLHKALKIDPLDKQIPAALAKVQSLRVAKDK